HEAIGRAVAGVRPAESGTITLAGKPAAIRTPADAIAQGIGFATGKRAEEALAGTMTVKENLFLNPLNFGEKSFRPRSRARERTAAFVASSDLDELVQIADRVLAFSRGRIVAELARSELSVEALTRAVGGIAAAESLGGGGVMQ